MTHPLLDRLRSATCGSRELDCLIHEAFGRVATVPFHEMSSSFVVKGDEGSLYDAAAMPRPSNSAAYWLPKYTSSLDAALGLVERALPGVPVVIRKSTEGYWSYGDGVGPGNWGVILRDNPLGWTVAPTAPLALLVALLTALANKEAPDA